MCVRWSPHPRVYGGVQRWMRLRFYNRRTFFDFNRRFWRCVWETQERDRIIEERLSLIGHTLPPNFTQYCREYLGQDYFDNLPDSDEEEGGEREWENSQVRTQEDEGQDGIHV